MKELKFKNGTLEGIAAQLLLLTDIFMVNQEAVHPELDAIEKGFPLLLEHIVENIHKFDQGGAT